MKFERIYCIQDTLSSRAALGLPAAGFVQPLGRVRRASKGILHTNEFTAMRAIWGVCFLCRYSTRHQNLILEFIKKFKIYNFLFEILNECLNNHKK